MAILDNPAGAVDIIWLVFFRYYLTGRKAGTTDIFADNLPGLPDNISPSISGGYWVGFAVTRKTGLLDVFATMPFVRQLIAKVCYSLVFTQPLQIKHVGQICTAPSIVIGFHLEIFNALNGCDSPGKCLSWQHLGHLNWDGALQDLGVVQPYTQGLSGWIALTDRLLGKKFEISIPGYV